jgi:hypothetical protein
MAEVTPQAESQIESLNEQIKNCPSEALYMDWDTAMHRAKALFRAICDLSSYTGVDNSGPISELASLGEAIIEDQLNSQEAHGDEE